MGYAKTVWMAAGFGLALGAAGSRAAPAAANPPAGYSAADTSNVQVTQAKARQSEFAARLGRELDTLGDRIAELKVKAKTGGAKAKKRTNEEIDRLEAARERAAARLDTLAKAGEGKWEAARERSSREVDSLKAALDRLWKKVKD